MSIEAISIYLLVINLLAFATYAVDKRRARDGGWRVPERRLLLLAVVGGALGSFVAMRLTRHKTRKRKFTWTVTPLMVLQLLAYALLVALTLLSAGSYAAGNEALRALEGDEDVQVSALDDGYLFDGQGSDELLVFYPGGLVDTEAYAPLMRGLADAGIDCYLVDMPYHLAFLGIGRAGRVFGRYDGYDRLYLGGHSLGGVAAGLYARDNADELEGIVLLASYVTVDLSNSELRALSVYGTKDGVLRREAYERNFPLLPEATTELVLEGGNHAQFGDYGKQRGDGAAGVSAAQQRQETVDAILELTGDATDAQK